LIKNLSVQEVVVMKKIIKNIFVISALTILSVGSANATIAFSDNFDTEPLGVPAADLMNWDISPATVDTVGEGGSFGYLCNNGNGGRCLDMDGTPAGNATITTKEGLDLVAGTYTFSFDYGNNGSKENTLTWNIGTLFTDMVTSNAGNQSSYTNYSFSFTLASLVEDVDISFVSGGLADQQGTILDNVLLEVVEASTPSVAILMLLGLMGLIYRKK
jgi:hypothetical protein